jgi:hypothetical protein
MFPCGLHDKIYDIFKKKVSEDINLLLRSRIFTINTTQIWEIAEACKK